LDKATSGWRPYFTSAPNTRLTASRYLQALQLHKKVSARSGRTSGAEEVQKTPATQPAGNKKVQPCRPVQFVLKTSLRPGGFA
jgi:hypothetical protein